LAELLVDISEMISETLPSSEVLVLRPFLSHRGSTGEGSEERTTSSSSSHRGRLNYYYALQVVIQVHDGVEHVRISAEAAMFFGSGSASAISF
jgi:hypothetical protein